MWLIIHKQSKRESYSHRKETKATMVEEIKHITTKNKNKNELRILAAVLTLCIYPENDHDPDCDKYLNLFMNICPAFHPPSTNRT